MLSLLVEILLGLSIVIGAHSNCAYGKRLLTNADLLNGDYDEIHRRAVIDQVQHHVWPQKSIHTRQTTSLNGIYDFCFDDSNQGFDKEWHSTSLKQSCRKGNFYRMPVPSAFNDITSNKTARNYIGWFWYQTTFTLPASWSPSFHDAAPKQRFIQFENINYMSIIWLQPRSSPPNATSYPNNGTYMLGSHVGGHLPFKFNITDALAEKATSFRLTIAVSNLLTKDTIPSGKMINMTEQVGSKFFKFQPDFDFFHFSGILDSVTLIQLPQVHIERVNLLSGSLLTNNSPNLFNVCLSRHFGSIKPTDFKLELQILTIEEEFIGESGITKKDPNLELPTCYKIEFQGLQHPQRFSWSLSNGNPNHLSPLVLARFRIELLSIDNSIDSKGALQNNSFYYISDLFELKLGVGPKALVDRERGLLVGESDVRTQLQGFGMHHEQMFSGRTMSRAAIMKDIYLLKQIGANLIRTSHYPYSTQYLEACDEHGILVIAECPAVGLNSFGELKLMLHKQILLEMLERDHHHASIIMWSVANEPQSQQIEAKGYFESLLQYVREDLSQYIVGRPLTAALAQSHTDDKVGHTLDVIMVNRYYGWYDYTGVVESIRLPLIASLSGWSQKYGKPLILSEFGADTISGFHSSTSELFTEEYQCNLLSRYEEVFDELFCENKTYTVNFWGSMIWNFADFSTHTSLLRADGNKKGLFSSARLPKLSVSKIKNIYLNRQKTGCHNKSEAISLRG